MRHEDWNERRAPVSSLAAEISRRSCRGSPAAALLRLSGRNAHTGDNMPIKVDPFLQIHHARGAAAAVEIFTGPRDIHGL